MMNDVATLFIVVLQTRTYIFLASRYFQVDVSFTYLHDVFSKRA